MTIARAQMYRQLYQMGGIGTLPMDFGQPLQVTQQQQPLFTTTGSATSNPLLNYGQTGLNQAGGTALTRSNYQEGGLSDFYKAEEPIIPRIESIGGLLDQAEKSIGQPANNFSSPLASTFSRFGMQEGGMGMDQMMQGQGIMGAIPQEAGMMQEGGQEQTALLTIIQLLIEQGVPPEQAEELAMQILQVFNQGGQPAVEEFANQLEQEEGMPENRTMMAGGGITGIYPRQGYFFKGVVKAVTGAVKGVAKAVKSVAKSPIGQIALAIAAPYAIGAMFPSFATLGGTGFLGGALRAGISNLAIQGITTGKFDPKQALIAGLAGGALSGLTSGTTAASIDPSTGLPTDSITGTITQPSIPGSLESGLQQTYKVPLSTPDITGSITQPSSFLSTPVSTGLEGQIGTGYATAPINQPFQLQGVGTGSPIDMSSVYSDYSYPSTVDKFSTKISDIGTNIQSGIQNLYSDPIGTIGRGIGATYDLAKKYPAETILAATTALGALAPQQPGEPDDSYEQRKADYDRRVAEYITQYGGGSKVYSPSFYSMEKATDPFAGRSTYAAMGGRIGYEYGSMPMGEPRKNPAGIMELDYRKKGGFVPPIGIKEKADDIPAMLSNNEFVFTADAVRNAGGGSVNKGAKRMYSLMKQLEAGGVV